MATAPWKRKQTSERLRTPGEPLAHLRADTDHLKAVPESRQVRETLRRGINEVIAKVDKSRPLSKSGMEAICRELLSRLDLTEAYLGWTMVMLLSAFWQDQVAATDFSQRLLLLPGQTPQADNGEAGILAVSANGQSAPAANVGEFCRAAEELGYRVLVANRSSDFMQTIMAGEVSAIIGLASLDLLERVTDKVILAGIACQAIPLSDEPGTIDHDWIFEMIRARQPNPPAKSTKTYLHLLRAAAGMFQSEELDRLAPRVREANSCNVARLGGRLDPIGATEALAYEFLRKGGKHLRPFITLAVYDALQGGGGTGPLGHDATEQLPDAIRRAALSIETFHKASLVHDDIEDDDEFRYGVKTLHRVYGTPTAINVGDYLIGLGYRLVSRERAELGAEVTADILDSLADAHLRLSEGQGAELMWRDSHNKILSPRDAIHIYALKTAPAFQAALYTGVRLAGPVAQYAKPIAQFAQQVGIAFQILNDLNDWEGDVDNKLLACGDVVGGRPTVLWAMALEGLSASARDELIALAMEQPMSPVAFAKIKDRYAQAGVFERAAQLIEKHQRRAEAIAAAMEPEGLKGLFFYLIDIVLDRQSRPVSAPKKKGSA